MPAIVVILLGALIAVSGLVLDGGTALATREKAADVAQEAARAGVDAGSAGQLRAASSGTGAPLNPAVAKAAAKAWLAAVGSGVTGTVSVSGGTVTVTAHVTRSTTVLSMFGVNTVSGDGTATATDIFGTTTEGH
jgi:hypothetical protein